ncbi:MAG: hypothetical protein G01um101438_974 [Parcubacteria group bacterium Gr01-1014_38]|nr:MAG: hypothetical protein G01um101438_974 [Parcubacteria group bacterium Gr01-1014_38]
MHHQTLTEERWRALPVSQRLLAVGAELKRLQHWLGRGDASAARACVERALELLDLTISASDPGLRRRELCRAREIVRGVLSAADPQHEARLLTRTLIGDL